MHQTGQTSSTRRTAAHPGMERRMKSSRTFLWTTALAILLTGVAGCGGDDDVNPAPEKSIFGLSCPVPGVSSAQQLTQDGPYMTGPDAIGRKNDYLLMNDQAAYIVEDASNVNAYYLYGGIVVDAVALTDCKQASPERFEELGFLMGTLKVSAFEESILRAFRGDSVEIVNDGSDGKAAVVRVHGEDDFFYLTEYELLRSALDKGKNKGMSEPFGIDIAVDYILEPDSPVLTIRLHFSNRESNDFSMLAGTAVMFGDSTPTSYFADNEIAIGEFTLDRNVPWMMASAGDGAWAFSMADADMGTTNIAGVTALINVNQALVDSIDLAPAGQEGDSAEVTYFLSVGGGDANSAVKHLQRFNPTPIAKKSYTLKDISGSVTDAAGGGPLAGIRVEMQALNGGGNWMPLEIFYTDEQGNFAGQAADFGDAFQLRFQALAQGRPPSDFVTWTADSGDPVALTLQPGGTLKSDIHDPEGTGLPAKVLLWKDGGIARRISVVNGNDETLVEPGSYDVTVTRGYEYSVYESSIDITASQTATLSVELTRLVDTSGYLSVDAHIHAGPSPDNYISIPERIRTVAAEGLEVVVGTDHEYISDWYPAVEETGLQAWVATVIGQEVTASMPEHTNMYPVEPRFDINARGGFIPWYGLDLAQIFAAEKDRGARITALNHPRKFFKMIEYDRLTGTSALEDVTVLGYGADARVWDWNFNTVELMNDPEFIFRHGDSQDEIALFDEWMSFQNLGHRITAIGVSDGHNYCIPGRPRVYFPSSTDNPAAFVQDELIDAMQQGTVLVSAGAFARVSVNGEATMGDTVTDSDGTIDLAIRIEAIPEVDVTYFKVYANCDQVLARATDAPNGVVKFDGTVQLTLAADAHIVVMGFGGQSIPAAFGDYNPAGIPRVVTNPVFVNVDGNDVWDAPGGKTCTYDLNPPETTK